MARCCSKRMRDVSVDPLASKVYLDWPLAKLTQAGAADTSRVFVVAELSAGWITDLAQPRPTSRRPKRFTSSRRNSTSKPSGANGSYKIRISSPVLARDVYLSFGDLDVKLSDNYFDMLPGETGRSRRPPAPRLMNSRRRCKVISLTDAFAAPSQPATVSAAH